MYDIYVKLMKEYTWKENKMRRLKSHKRGELESKKWMMIKVNLWLKIKVAFATEKTGELTITVDGNSISDISTVYKMFW